jgi:hypothetical protein
MTKLRGRNVGCAGKGLGSSTSGKRIVERRAARHRRMRIHAAAFEGDVVRAHIAFLEHEKRYAECIRYGLGGNVVTPAVAEADHAIDVFRDQEIAQEIGKTRHFPL